MGRADSRYSQASTPRPGAIRPRAEAYRPGTKPRADLRARDKWQAHRPFDIMSL